MMNQDDDLSDDDKPHDLEHAECREERRWMERENQRMARAYKKDEMQTIGDLVFILI